MYHKSLSLLTRTIPQGQVTPSIAKETVALEAVEQLAVVAPSAQDADISAVHRATATKVSHSHSHSENYKNFRYGGDHKVGGSVGSLCATISGVGGSQLAKECKAAEARNLQIKYAGTDLK